MKRKDETLREELLEYARELSQLKGYDKITIRTLAKCAGIATGTVYNYFGSKDEILLALTDEFWLNAMNKMSDVIVDASFDNQLEQIYGYLYTHIEDAAQELMNSLGTVREAGRQRMSSMHTLMSKNMICYLEKDKEVRSEVWTDVFTKEKFVDFIIKNIMLSLRAKAEEIDFLVEIVRRILY